MIACVSRITKRSGFSFSIFAAVFLAIRNCSFLPLSKFEHYSVCILWDRLSDMLRPFDDDDVHWICNYFVPSERAQFICTLETIRINVHKPLPFLARKSIYLFNDKGWAIYRFFDIERLRNRLCEGRFPRTQLSGKRNDRRGIINFPEFLNKITGKLLHFLSIPHARLHARIVALTDF